MAAGSEKSGKSDRESLESRQVSPLGRAVRWFREDQGLSQENLADLAKIDKQRIADVERGETQNLHSPTLKALANGLGVSTAELRAKAQEFREADKAGAATEAPSRTPSPPILHPDIRHVPGFVGRADLMAGIDDALWRKGGTAALTNDTASAAVKGLGGVGKSVLAREWAWLNRERYRGVWWVRAETEQTLIDDLIDLGSRLIPNLKEAPERDRALHQALDAIAAAGGDKPWLIVYDNVEKPGAIRKLKPREHAHILVTSRWPDWQDEAEELPVDVFAPDVAIDYLIGKRPHETREAASRLAEALGYLPLALNHARAYCAETNLSFDDYARRLSELIQEAPEDAEYPASVFATFSLAIAKAAEVCPEAEKLMEIAAFLAPEKIPLDIFNQVMSDTQRDKAVATLFKMSLVSHELFANGSRAIRMHRLIREVMRQELVDIEILVFLNTQMIDSITCRLYPNTENADQIAALVYHRMAISGLSHGEIPGIPKSSDIIAVLRLAIVLNQKMDISFIVKPSLSLANELFLAGKQRKAKGLLFAVLQVCLRNLEPHHPDLNTLIMSYEELSDSAARQG